MTARTVRVTAPAKLNLDLRVLYRRPDQYHELRTIFQTISLADTMDITFTPARRTAIDLAANIDIPDNLAAKAARLALDAMRVPGRIELRLTKRIPLGSGLGGGSSDAAAVLLALPVLAGRSLTLDRLIELAAELGSDVPFFLLGGTAAGIGRGTELFPLPDAPARAGLLITSREHVSTAQAYAALAPRLTSESQQNKMVSFQSQVWLRDVSGNEIGSNDFEAVVFEQLPQLARLKRRLERLGARPALMTGSGSAVFGLFRTRDEVSRAIKSLGEERVFPISLVSRARFRSMWWRRLQAHMEARQWPPRSRYER
jgi:4-diphosphocytidyl-2-C-methyl-D-erythritol kinase